MQMHDNQFKTDSCLNLKIAFALQQHFSQSPDRGPEVKLDCYFQNYSE